MYHVDRRLNMFDRRCRQDAMAQIEDVSIAITGTTQNILHSAFDFMERSIEGDRVEVPLHGAIIADHCPGLIEMNPPIHADHIPTRLAHLPQYGCCPGAKMNQGHAFPHESLEDQLHVRLHIFGVVAGRKTPDPAVEELDG